MANQVFINDQHIVECNVVGDQTVNSIEAMGKKIEDLFAQLKAERKPLLMIDNITKMGNVPPEARRLVVTLGKTLPYDRLAMVGKGGLLQVGANLVIRGTGRSRKCKYFSGYQQAVTWLQQI